jgi:hypothetical protein
VLSRDEEADRTRAREVARALWARMATTAP